MQATLDHATAPPRPGNAPRSLPAILAEAERLLAGANPEGAAILLATAAPNHQADPRLLLLNARALIELGHVGRAIGALFLAADLQPDNPAIPFALAALLLGQHPDQALPHSLRAFELAPGHLQATALSAVLIAQGRDDAALAAAQHALAIVPGHAEALINAALALQGLARPDEAASLARQAVAAAPDNPQARYNLACLLLARGEWTPEAWALFDWRLRLEGNPDRLAESPAQRWHGEDIAGQTILLQAEQGFGDTLQFVRYAPLVAKRAGRVVLQVQPELLRLLQGAPGVDQLVAIGDPAPPFDRVCPLLSLPGIFATTLDDIPPPVPYAATFARAQHSRPQALRVGVVWAGSQTNQDDRRRSLALASLAPLAAIPGVQLYSLQRHEPGRPPPPPGIIDLMPGIADFTETAALIDRLDLVVTVDTALAHLAATMGKPTWLLSRIRGCWRWLRHRADTPWYPTLRIIRQERPNDWTAPLDQIRRDLEAIAAARPTAAAPVPAPAPATPLCKACATPAAIVGAVDFSKCCEDRRRPPLPLSGRPVAYHQCPACSLLFTPDFDDWTQDDFRQHIYNDAYLDADPDYLGARPAGSAALIGNLFGPACRGMEALDYGGGDGALARLLNQNHGMRAQAFDPFNPACDIPPARTFPLVTCFEVLEHTPNPRATIQQIASLVQPGGLVVFSTLLQSADAQRQGLSWWYVAPRNGHVTIYSPQSLQALWQQAGFTLVSQTDNLHFATRRPAPTPGHNRASPPPS